MKIINPTAEVWKQNPGIDGIWEHIAKCTRVCYQSSPKQNESAEDFVKRVILRHKPWFSEANHLAMLEHGTVYLTIPATTTENLMFIHALIPNKYTKWKKDYNEKYDTNNYHITTNLRVLVENGLLGALKYICIPNENHYRRVTVCFTTNIGVSREFNRHRVNSIAEESTRYCNYAHPKFGTGISIGNACDEFNISDKEYYGTNDWIRYMDKILNMENPNMNALDWYIFGLLSTEQAYLNMIKLGANPNQARRVLPLATKSQLIHTAFLDDWKHFFDLRVQGVSGTPHPDAKYVGSLALNEMIKENIL